MPRDIGFTPLSMLRGSPNEDTGNTLAAKRRAAYGAAPHQGDDRPRQEERQGRAAVQHVAPPGP